MRAQVEEKKGIRLRGASSRICQVNVVSRNAKAMGVKDLVMGAIRKVSSRKPPKSFEGGGTERRYEKTGSKRRNCERVKLYCK